MTENNTFGQCVQYVTMSILLFRGMGSRLQYFHMMTICNKLRLIKQALRHINSHLEIQNDKIIFFAVYTVPKMSILPRKSLGSMFLWLV